MLSDAFWEPYFIQKTTISFQIFWEISPKYISYWYSLFFGIIGGISSSLLKFRGVFVCHSWFNFVAFLPSSSVSDVQNSPNFQKFSYKYNYNIIVISYFSWKFDINFLDVSIDRIALRASETPLFFKKFPGASPPNPHRGSAPGPRCLPTERSARFACLAR